MERSFKDGRAYKRAPMSSIIGSVNDFRRSRRISLFCIPFRAGRARSGGTIAISDGIAENRAVPLIKTRQKQFQATEHLPNYQPNYYSSY